MKYGFTDKYVLFFSWEFILRGCLMAMVFATVQGGRTCYQLRGPPTGYVGEHVLAV